MRDIRLGIAGCGAVTENFHLPALLATPGLTVSVLADLDRTRAAQLADQYGAVAVSDLNEKLSDVNAVIIAVPNNLHADLAVSLLRSGKHVLLEKPMALNVADCSRVLKASAEAGAVLAVGHVRRFYPSSLFLKEVFDSGVLGRVLRFDFPEGKVFRWPVRTDALFRKDITGGGVLMDIGIHVLDLVLWWFGECEHVAYEDDSHGGIEADCEVRLRMSSGVEGRVQLSRLRDLSNRWVIETEHARLEAGPDFNAPVHVSFRGATMGLAGVAQAAAGSKPDSILYAFQKQAADFIQAIRSGVSPLVNGAEGMRSVELIERCYKSRQPAEPLWEKMSVRGFGVAAR